VNVVSVMLHDLFWIYGQGTGSVVSKSFDPNDNLRNESFF
jgi:hypothetical protein